MNAFVTRYRPKPDEAELKKVVLGLPAVLGISIEANVLPKLDSLQRELCLSDEALRERILRDGRSATFGARPLRRTVQRLVEDVIAETFLDGFIGEGDDAIESYHFYYCG